MEHISKRFPGVLASDDISLSVEEGQILALVGENGAGKTTLMNILMGIYQQDEGKIFINDKEVHFRGPEDAFNAGLGMVHQQYMLVPNMTVTENVALGYKQAWKPLKLDLDMVRSRVVEISSYYGLAVNPETKEIFVTDAKNYVSPGTLYCFSPDGKKKWSVTTGDIPAHFAFLKK